MIFADLALARRLERPEAVAGAHFSEAHARVAPEVGAEWMEADGVYANYDGPQSPVTQTFGLGLFSLATPVSLELLESFFRVRGATSVCHEVCPLAGVELAQLLTGRGYRPIEFTSILYLPLPASHLSTTPLNPRIGVRLMHKGEEERWSQIFARGFAAELESMDFMLTYSRAISTLEGADLFVAHLDGEPIANGVLRGCDLAMMGALPGSSSQRNAERQGFRIAYTRTKWQLLL